MPLSLRPLTPDPLAASSGGICPRLRADDAERRERMQPTEYKAAQQRVALGQMRETQALREIAQVCRDNLMLGPEHCKGGLFDYILDVARVGLGLKA